MKLVLKLKCNGCGQEYEISSNDVDYDGATRVMREAIEEILEDHSNLSMNAVTKETLKTMREGLHLHVCEDHDRWKSFGVSTVIGLTIYKYD